MPRILTGKCLCETVKFQVEDDFRYSLVCHCSQCRRATGAANKPFAGIESAKISIVDGTNSILRYGEGENHDVRCGHCGSLLFSVVSEGKFVHVTLGALSEAPTLLPSAHIFVGSKAPWEIIADGLPQHQEF
ncbi:MAG: GFA family protein [Burkholderiales bacterium]|nr:GFA family protein [Burkholderiales bacterium]